MQILGISGSLRGRSTNTAALRAAARLAPASMNISVFEGIGSLPLFNPDLEIAMPVEVAALRAAVAAADGLLIASPEYAHGVSGVLKNALDWLVSGEEFVGKPVAVINASPRAAHGHAALIETIRTMSGRVIEAACVRLPLLGKDMDAAGIVADPELASLLRGGLMRYASALEAD